MNINQQIDFWAHMLDEAMQDKTFITEGKHWPEDYKKTAFTTIKSSKLGQQSWYTDDFIKQDVDTIANEFGPLAHKNSNLGFFATIIRWFVEYAEDSKRKYQEFIEIKLDSIIQDLQQILNDPKLDQAKRDSLKKISFTEFEKMQKANAENLKSADGKYSGKEKNEYDIIFIKTYEELHEKVGGDKTGYKGESEWCHTNGKSTYETWTSNKTKFFFVLAKHGWEKITPPDPKTTNAYDEYGTSLIAILVGKDGELLKATMRWNHVIEPSDTVAGTSVDRAFLTFKSLSDVVGMDVKNKVLAILKKEKVYSKYEGVVYSENGLRCEVVDGHFVWVDENDNDVKAPDKIDGNFNCLSTAINGNLYDLSINITSLKGAPQKVGGEFDCSNTKIKSLEGAPQEVSRFRCMNTRITSLEYAPQKVSGDFICSQTDITSLKYAPQEVGGNFKCSNTKIKSLEGAPREVSGDFDCFNTKIKSLKGAPQKVGGRFYCPSSRRLSSLEGAPQEVGGDFDCSTCYGLSSLEGAPQKVGGSFYCYQTNITSDQKNAYKEFLKHPTPEHIDATGHYKP